MSLTNARQFNIKPYIVHWMYTTVIRSTLMHGAPVCWKVIDKKTRLSCLAITGTITSVWKLYWLFPLFIYKLKLPSPVYD